LLLTRRWCYVPGHNVGLTGPPTCTNLIDGRCTWSVTAATTLYVSSFITEGHFDTLTVNGVTYSGSSPTPNNVNVASGSTIAWRTDTSIIRAGFCICANQSIAAVGCHATSNSDSTIVLNNVALWILIPVVVVLLICCCLGCGFLIFAVSTYLAVCPLASRLPDAARTCTSYQDAHSLVAFGVMTLPAVSIGQQGASRACR
jgi:hypothetical protein